MDEIRELIKKIVVDVIVRIICEVLKHLFKDND